MFPVLWCTKESEWVKTWPMKDCLSVVSFKPGLLKLESCDDLKNILIFFFFVSYLRVLKGVSMESENTPPCDYDKLRAFHKITSAIKNRISYYIWHKSHTFLFHFVWMVHSFDYLYNCCLFKELNSFFKKYIDIMVFFPILSVGVEEGSFLSGFLPVYVQVLIVIIFNPPS